MMCKFTVLILDWRSSFRAFRIVRERMEPPLRIGKPAANRRLKARNQQARDRYGAGDFYRPNYSRSEPRSGQLSPFLNAIADGHPPPMQEASKKRPRESTDPSGLNRHQRKSLSRFFLKLSFAIIVFASAFVAKGMSEFALPRMAIVWPSHA